MMVSPFVPILPSPLAPRPGLSQNHLGVGKEEGREGGGLRGCMRGGG